MSRPASEKSRNWHVHAAGFGVVAASIVGSYALGVRPVAHARDSQAELADAVAMRQQEVQEREAELRRLESRIAGTSRRLDETTIELTGPRRLNQRLAGLTELAVECGLQVDEMRPARVQDAEMYRVLPIAFTGTGPVVACSAFLSGVLERFPDMHVSAFLLETDRAGEQRGEARFVFDLAWYVTLDDGAG